MNLIYTKYESLLLTTNPEKLFIPLYMYTGIVVVLIVWTLLSFKWIASLKEAKSKLEITNSYKNKSNEYEKIKDVLTYPMKVDDVHVDHGLHSLAAEYTE